VGASKSKIKKTQQAKVNNNIIGGGGKVILRPEELFESYSEANESIYDEILHGKEDSSVRGWGRNKAEVDQSIFFLTFNQEKTSNGLSPDNVQEEEENRKEFLGGEEV